MPTTYTQDLVTPLPVVLQAQTRATTTQYLHSIGTRPLGQYTSAWEYLLPDARPCPTLQQSVGGPLGVGSVRQIVDAAGDVTLAKSYEPYGSVLTSTGTASSIFAYAGEQIDTTGLIYLRARYMNPMLGIFLARDPWSGDVLRPGSMNGYSYVEGDPINQIDPSGREPEPPHPSHFIPDYNVSALAFNGYVEGVNWITSLFSQYVMIEGIEIVYDFVTHERARFTYHGRPIPLACGTTLGSLYDSTVSIYVGTYDFLGRGIEEYLGPFFNFSASYSPPALSTSVPVGGHPFPDGFLETKSVIMPNESFLPRGHHRASRHSVTGLSSRG